MSDITERIAVARFQTIKRWAYLAAMLYNLRIIVTEDVISNGTPTMGVDKWGRLYIHPDIDWKPAEMATVLAHECWHILRLHHKRFEGRDDRIANIACDAAINDDLISENAKFPLDPVTPQGLGFAPNLLEEEYYELLIKNASAMYKARGNTPGSGGDCGSCAGGDLRPWEQPGPGEGGPEGLSDIQIEAIRHKVAQDIKARGTGHGGLEKWADEIITPRVDPIRILRAFVSSLTRPGFADFAYNRPNRRSDDLVLPVLRGNQLPELAFLIDTSGSMSDEDLALALGTVNKAIKGGAKLTVYVGDTEVSGEATKIRTLADVRKLMSGRGGTDMGGIIDDLVHKRKKIKGLLVITDGYTPWTRVQPPFPVAVLLTNNSPSETVPEWAKVIRLHP